MSGLAGEAWRRLRLLFGQGMAARIDESTVQVEVFDSEVLEGVKRVEPYGFSYRPKVQSEVYLFFPAGDRARGVALLIGDKRYQMNLEAGEVALHDDEGNFVKIGRGGEVTVKAATAVVAETPLLKVTGNVEIAGTLQVAGAANMGGAVSVTGALTQGGKDVGGGHKHTSTKPGTPTSDVN